MSHPLILQLNDLARNQYRLRMNQTRYPEPTPENLHKDISMEGMPELEDCDDEGDTEQVEDEIEPVEDDNEQDEDIEPEEEDIKPLKCPLFCQVCEKNVKSKSKHKSWCL